MMRTLALFLCSALAAGFTVTPTTPASSRVAARSASPAMKGLVSDGPLGGSKVPGTEGGWIGDRSQSLQVKNFEEGTDYLFFQGPTPKTGVQDDLPSFFSGDNFADMDIGLPLFVTLGAGAASAAAIAALLVTG